MKSKTQKTNKSQEGTFLTDAIVATINKLQPLGKTLLNADGCSNEVKMIQQRAFGECCHDLGYKLIDEYGEAMDKKYPSFENRDLFAVAVTKWEKAPEVVPAPFLATAIQRGAALIGFLSSDNNGNPTTKRVLPLSCFSNIPGIEAYLQTATSK